MSSLYTKSMSLIRTRKVSWLYFPAILVKSQTLLENRLMKKSLSGEKKGKRR